MHASSSIPPAPGHVGPSHPALQAWLDACQLPIKASASTLGYATDAVRARLRDTPCPALRVALSVMDDRAAALRRDVERMARLLGYVAIHSAPPGTTREASLATTLRRVIDEAGPASRQRIGVTGWRHGRHPVPARIAHDAIQPVLENALVHGRGRVRVVLHPDAACGPWLTVSDSGPGIEPDEAARWLQPMARPPVTDSNGRPRLGLATAQLAALSLGCRWLVVPSGTKGLRLQLGGPRHHTAGGPGPA